MAKAVAIILERLNEKFDQLKAEARGFYSENMVEAALEQLEQEEILTFERSERGDERDSEGIDFEVWEAGEYQIHFTVDVKSSWLNAYKHALKPNRERNGHHYYLVVRVEDTLENVLEKVLDIFEEELQLKEGRAGPPKLIIP